MEIEKSFLVKLTVVLYKVSDFFPEKEPLKFSLREKANDVLAGSLLVFSESPAGSPKEERSKTALEILRDIEILIAYFEVAKRQNWLKEENFLVLQEEYNKIKAKIEQELAKKGEEKAVEIKKSQKPSFKTPLAGLKQRHKRILQVVGEKQPVQVRDMEKIFPEVTKRTLRRDFEELLKKGLVMRLGRQNKTVYKLSESALLR